MTLLWLVLQNLSLYIIRNQLVQCTPSHADQTKVTAAGSRSSTRAALANEWAFGIYWPPNKTHRRVSKHFCLGKNGPKLRLQSILCNRLKSAKQQSTQEEKWKKFFFWPTAGHSSSHHKFPVPAKLFFQWKPLPVPPTVHGWSNRHKFHRESSVDKEIFLLQLNALKCERHSGKASRIPK